MDGSAHPLMKMDPYRELEEPYDYCFLKYQILNMVVEIFTIPIKLSKNYVIFQYYVNK